MRICMVVHGPCPFDGRVQREARAAVAAGFEVDIVATQAPGQPREELVDGARVIRMPITHRYGGGLRAVVGEYTRFTALATSAVARLHRRRRYDVVHVHNPPDFLVLAALVPRLLGARVVFDVHDRAPDMFSMRFGGRRGIAAGERLLGVVERAATRFADAVITVHEPYKRVLVARGVPAAKVTVVMNSLDEELLRRRNGFPLSRDGFTVVYHGTLAPHYGVHLLVEAVARVAPVVELRAEIYGEGDAAPALKELIRKRGVEHRVSLLDRRLPHDEILERIQSASAGVITNLPIALNCYALSSKLFEYVALGVPAVSAALPTIREHFSEREVAFFTPGDADALAEALIGLAQDPEAARKRALEARRRYWSEYAWGGQAERYLGVLSAVLTGASRAESAFLAARRWSRAGAPVERR